MTNESFSLKIRSQPLPLLFGGSVLGVEHVNIVHGGSRFLTTLDETNIVTCFLSSKPSTCTCLVPFGSQVFSPPLGIKWTLINLIILHNKCKWNGVCFYEINNFIIHGCLEETNLVGICL